MEGYNQSSSDAYDKKTEMMENNPPLNLEKDIEWSELQGGDACINPVSPHLNSSSRSSMMFESFFDEVAKFSDINEDDIVMDYHVSMDGVHNDVYPYRGI